MRRKLGIFLMSIPILLLTITVIILLLDPVSRIGTLIALFMVGSMILGGHLYERG